MCTRTAAVAYAVGYQNAPLDVHRMIAVARALGRQANDHPGTGSRPLNLSPMATLGDKLSREVSAGLGCVDICMYVALTVGPAKSLCAAGFFMSGQHDQSSHRRIQLQ